MKIQELDALRQCPKYYEFKKIIIDKKNLQMQIFKDSLRIAANALKTHTSWQTLETDIRKLFQENVQEEWYTFSWQKKEAIEKNLFLLKRMYSWLESNIKGTILAVNQPLSIPVTMQCNGYDIFELGICPHFIIATNEGIWGILLCERFAKQYTYRAQKSGNSIYHSLELLCLLMGLENLYPGKTIWVSLIQAVSRKDTAHSFAVFERNSGDNVMTINISDLMKKESGTASEVMNILLQHTGVRNCSFCCYKELCNTERVADDRIHPVEKIMHPIVYTENQLQVIHHLSGPLRVCAGPGAGKTETLVARIQNLVVQGVTPGKILVVTFTKKAAQEILLRMNTEEKPTVSTLHALAFKIIREHECLIGRKKLVNNTDCKKMLLEVLKHAPVIVGANYENPTAPYGLLDNLLADFRSIEKLGKERFAQSALDKDLQTIFLVKAMYDQKFIAAGYIRFDDLIKLAVKLLEKHSGIRARLQNMFDYIMIDEVQDLDEIQACLVRLLTKSQANIAVFGDADQSIYGFRGGSNRFMLDFPKYFPGTVDVWLNDNFRSSGEILEMANLLISHNRDRVPIKMNAFFENGCQPELISDFRMNHIGLLVQDLLQEGYQQDDIAIIARTNKDLAGMCEMLDRYNAEHPKEQDLYFARPKYYLYQSPVYQVVLDLLTIHQGFLHEDAVWYRLLVKEGIYPEKYFPKKSIYENYLLRGIIYPFEGDEAGRYLVVNETDPLILQAAAKIYRMSRLFSLPVVLAITKVLQNYFNNDVIFEEELEVLKTTIHDRSIQSAKELWEYMIAAKSLHDETRIYGDSSHINQLHLLTAHDSKGKEFKVVILYGIDKFELDNMQEDRRLLYVAITRAKERIIMTEVFKGKSCFIKELEAHLIKKGGLRYA